MDSYLQAIRQIIKEQESIIGPIAWDQAAKVGGLKIVSTGEIQIERDGKEILNDLVNQYARLFGDVSIQVCKDALKEVKPSVSADLLPDILR